MEMPWNIWNIKAGYSTDVLGGQITEGTSIHSTIQKTWTVTSNAIKKSRRSRKRERERYSVESGAYCGCAGDRLYAVVWSAGLTVRLGRGVHVQSVLCHGGLARVVWSRVRVGRRVLSRNAVLRGSELGRWVRLGHGFWGCWGVLITLKKQRTTAKY